MQPHACASLGSIRFVVQIESARARIKSEQLRRRTFADSRFSPKRFDERANVDQSSGILIANLIKRFARTNDNVATSPPFVPVVFVDRRN